MIFSIGYDRNNARLSEVIQEVGEHTKTWLRFRKGRLYTLGQEEFALEEEISRLSRRPDNTTESNALLLQVARLLMLKRIVRDQKENPNENAIFLYGEANEQWPQLNCSWNWLQGQNFFVATGEKLHISGAFFIVDCSAKDIKTLQGPGGHKKIGGAIWVPGSKDYSPQDIAMKIWENLQPLVDRSA